MALTDDTTGGRVVKEGEMPVKITLAGTVYPGDLVGYSGGWVAADADAPIEPELIAGVYGVSTDIIVAYKRAVIGGITCAADDSIYASATAGRYTSTAAGIGMLVGRGISTTEMLIDLSPNIDLQLRRISGVSYTGEPLVQWSATDTEASGGAYDAMFKLTVTNSLAKTGGRLCGMSINVEPKASTDVYQVYGAEVCTYLSAAVTASGAISAVGLFVETQGGTSLAGDWYSLYVYSAPGQAPSGSSSVVRLEHNSAVATDNFIVFVNGSTCPGVLFTCGPVQDTTAWNGSAAGSSTNAGYLKVKVGTATRYINLYSDAP